MFDQNIKNKRFIQLIFILQYWWQRLCWLCLPRNNDITKIIIDSLLLKGGAKRKEKEITSVNHRISSHKSATGKCETLSSLSSSPTFLSIQIIPPVAAPNHYFSEKKEKNQERRRRKEHRNNRVSAKFQKLTHSGQCKREKSPYRMISDGYWTRSVKLGLTQ